MGDILNHFDHMLFRLVSFSESLVTVIQANNIDAPEALARWENMRVAWVEYLEWKQKLLNPGGNDGEHK